MVISKKLLFAYLLLALSVLTAGIILYLNTLLNQPSTRSYLLSTLSSMLQGYEIQADQLNLALSKGVAVRFRNLLVISRDGTEKLTAAHLTITLAVPSLLRGELVPVRILLFRPDFTLHLPHDNNRTKPVGALAMDNIIQQNLSFLKSATIRDGSLYLPESRLTFRNIYFRSYLENGVSENLHAEFSTTMYYKNHSADCRIKGVILSYSSEDGFLVDFEAQTSEVPLVWIPCQNSMPVKGKVRIHLKIAGALKKALSVDGIINTNDVHFNLNSSGPARSYILPNSSLAFTALYSKSIFEFSSIKIEGNEFSFFGRANVDISNRSLPFLNLSMKSQPMALKTFKKIFPAAFLPVWIEHDIFPQISNGMAVLEQLDVKGTLQQIAELNRKENSRVLSMKIRLNDLSAFSSNLSTPITALRAHLSYQDGNLRVSDVSARFGQSRIYNAFMDLDNLYAKDPLFRYSLKTEARLEDLLQFKSLDLIPLSIRKHLQPVTSLKGSLKGSLTVEDKHGWEIPRIRQSVLLIRNCSIQHQGLMLPLVFQNMDLHFDDQSQCRYIGSGYWGTSSFQGSGTAENLFQTFKADMILSADANEISTLFHRDKQFLGFNNDLPVTLLVKKKDGRFSFYGKVAAAGLCVETDKYFFGPGSESDEVEFNIVWQPDAQLVFSPFIARLGDSELTASGAFNLKNMDTLNLKVTAMDLNLKDLKLFSFEKKIPANGVLSTDIEINYSFVNPHETRLQGEISCWDMTLPFNLLSCPVRDLHCKIVFSGRDLHVPLLSFNLGQSRQPSPVFLSANLSGWHGLKGRVSVHAPILDLFDILDSKSVSRKNSDSAKQHDMVGSFITDSDIQFDIEVESCRLGDIVMHPVTVTGAYQKGELSISQCQMHLEQGTISTKAKISPLLVSLESVFQLERYPFNNLISSFPFFKNLKITDGLL